VTDDGRKILIETSAITAVINGCNLCADAHIIANGLCGIVEAFNPLLRGMLANPLAPFVSSIRFYDPPRRTDDEHDRYRTAPFKPTLVS